MIHHSPFPPLHLPLSNILTYLFPATHQPSDSPIWIDAANPSTSLSPYQLLSWVRRLALGLQARTNHGDVVLLFTPNHIFVPAAYLGIVGAGRIFSGASPACTVSELEYQLRDTSARVLLAHPSLLDVALRAAAAAGLGKENVFLFDDQECAVDDVVADWRTLLADEKRAREFVWDEMEGTSGSTVATVNYSSGTTGMPKGVCVSHANIIANAEQTIFMRDQEQEYQPHDRPQERWIGFLPLYHAYGQLYACVMAPKLQTPVYIMKKFIYPDFLSSIQTFRITHLQVAPPILIMLMKRPENADYDISSVRHILCGGAPLQKDLQNDVQKSYSLRVIQGWGMTEVTCGALTVPGGASDDTGSVGLLYPSCEGRLLDEHGNEAGPGEPGELCIRGPNVCLGYWRNRRATEETFDRDGWLHTGDVASVKDGWFWIVDRMKEMIKVNALQVAPAELEALLLQNEEVADAAVVGVTLDGEEWPRAYVVLREGVRESREKGEEIAGIIAGGVAKHKRLVGGVKFVQEIPRLASGKIVRKLVKAWAEEDARILKHPRPAKL